jgi:hypothetical protein
MTVCLNYVQKTNGNEEMINIVSAIYATTIAAATKQENKPWMSIEIKMKQETECQN